MQISTNILTKKHHTSLTRIQEKAYYIFNKVIINKYKNMGKGKNAVKANKKPSLSQKEKKAKKKSKKESKG